MASTSLSRSARTTGARPDWAKATRNAIAITIPVLLGAITDRVTIGATAALGAYLVAFADDKGGAFWPRVRAMSICVVWCAFAFFIGALAAPYIWIGVLVVALATLAWGFVSSAGPTASVIASMAATAALFATESSGEPTLALTASLVAGGVFIVALTVVAIPFADERPAQAQLELAIFRTRNVLRNCTTATNSENEAARAAARNAIAAARSVAEESFGRDDERTLQRFAILRSSERFMKLAGSERFRTRHLRESSEPLDPRSAAASDALLSQYEEMLANPPTAASERNDEPALSRASFWTRLRPALQPHSDGFAYALRFTIVAVVGLVIAALSQVPHGGWVTVSSWRALRPTYLVTITRAQQRLGGTVVGGLAASGLLFIIPLGIPQAVTIGLASFLCFAMRPLNYGLYVVFATLVILTLLALGQPADLETTIVRVVATALGVALAVAGARWILPRWSNTKARARCVAAMRADSQYLATIHAAYEGRYDIADVTQARRAAEDANSAAYSAFDQMSVEPTTQDDELELIRQMVTVSATLRDGLIASTTLRVAESAPRSDTASELANLQVTLSEFIALAASPAAASEIEVALVELEAQAEYCFEITNDPLA